jgi:signal transduction histidine kinase
MDPIINRNCYLCGKPIKNQLDIFFNYSEEGVKRFHHKSCYGFFNRLISIYGDDFSHLELDRVKWGSGSERGDLLELSLYDIKNSKYLKSEVVSDFAEFKAMFLDEYTRAKSTIDILFSNSSIFKRFGKLLEAALLSSLKNQLQSVEVRILLVESKDASELLDRFRIREISNINVNYINDNRNNYFLSLFDRSVAFFSELSASQNSNKHRRYVNIISRKESMVWHGAAAFESLWKQSLLEGKIKKLSIKIRNDTKPSNNYMRILAHELKNPIQPILGFSDMIQNNTRLDGDQKNDLLKIISRNARKLDIMTNNILDYARMENNNFTLNYETFDIIKVFEELLSDYSIQINRKKLSLNLEYSEKPLYIRADKVRIIEVLDNLIGNAIKFTEKGRIDLSVERLENSIHFKVKDTGRGINDKDFKKLFTKFFTTDKLGTGLGLYLSKIIILRHGGEIQARNNENGEGSVFTIDLPV